MKALVEVAKAKAALKQAEERLDRVRAHRRVLCSCGKKHPLAALTLLITHFYIQPYGCTEGDYWKEGEWQFVCPTTNVRNRILFDDYAVNWKQRDVIGVSAEATFKHLYYALFAQRHQMYGEGTNPSPTFNNYFIDQHRKHFELPARPGGV